MKKETQTQIIQDKTLQMLELLKKLFDDNDIPFFFSMWNSTRLCKA